MKKLQRNIIVALCLIGASFFFVYLPWSFSDQYKHRAYQKLAGSFVRYDYSEALYKYKRDTGGYPSTAEGLIALVRDSGAKGWSGPYLKEIEGDPWGKPYQYTSPGQHGAYDLFSYEKDGLVGGDGFNEDITSWAVVPESKIQTRVIFPAGFPTTCDQCHGNP